MTAVTEPAARAGTVSSTREKRSPLNIPWPHAAILIATGFLIVAVVLLVTAWGGASRQVDPRDQVLWLNVAVAAVSVLGAGCAVWLLVGRRSVAARSRFVQQELERGLGLDRRADAAPRQSFLVTATGLTRRHLSDCSLMAGRVAVVAGDGLEPCGVCDS